MINANNLNLSLLFDPAKKFLICGELVKFNLKIDSPDFQDAEMGVVSEFMERIGAAVEAVEIVEEDVLSDSKSSLSSQNSNYSNLGSNGRKMKSVESLSNLLRATSLNNSKNNSNSTSSMSSVTARRFNSLSQNQSAGSKAHWCEAQSAIMVPLEAFIDPECLSLHCHRATVKFKISLNELVPINEGSEDGKIAFGFDMFESSISAAARNSHRLQKIGQAEVSFPVLRPLEVALRTHSLSPIQVILQINLEMMDNPDSGTCLNIEQVDIALSDSFSTSQQNTKFKITPMTDSQVPFVFETCPQQRSLLYNWTLLDANAFDYDESDDFSLRVELFGELLSSSSSSSSSLSSSSEISLSFESVVPLFNLFPKQDFSGVQITAAKMLNGNGVIRPFEPFHVEFILHNFDDKARNLLIQIDEPVKKQKSKGNASTNPIQEWFQMERRKMTPGLLLMTPLTALKVENLPAGGSKAIRLQFLAAKKGIFNLKDEFKVQEMHSSEVMKFKEIIIKVE